MRLAPLHEDPERHIDWDLALSTTENIYGDLATWWVQATEGVNYYRAEMPAKHLPGRTIRLLPGDLQMDEYGNGRFSRQEGAAIWMFPGNTTRAILMTEMHLQGIPVFVEIDDDYTTGPPVRVLSSWHVKRDRSGRDEHSYEVHKKIVRSKAVTGVIVSTPALRERYRFLKRNIHVCPNSIDPDDWPDEMPPHQPDGILRVGWAGSASHAYDLADIQRALDWASRQPDVEVVLMGQLDLPIKHRLIPWANTLDEYRQNVSQIDVMLTPLHASPWADCKSDVKALEAAMGGACSIVSRTEPYRPWWGEDRPCYVADDAKGFLKAVKHVVRHRDETRETARLAREYVLTERTIHQSIHHWQEAIQI